MTRAVFTTLTLGLAWLAWSGHMGPQMLAFGGISVGVVAGITRRMDRFSGADRDEPLGLRVILYLPWLLWQIVRSNVAVAMIVLNPKLPIGPSLIRVPASQRTAKGQVLYANSITLTPGTISLDVRDDTILVHALTPEFEAGVGEGEMGRRISRLERKA